ncbi:hypothetical protein D3C87_2136530 [compost metagenome]
MLVTSAVVPSAKVAVSTIALVALTAKFSAVSLSARCLEVPTSTVIVAVVPL